MCGTGFGPLVTRFNDNIKKAMEESGSPDLDNVFQKALIQTQNEYNLDTGVTNVLFSYSFFENNEIKLNIELMSSLSQRAGISGSNKLVVLQPTGYDDKLEKIENKYTHLIEKTESLNELIYLTADYIEKVAEVNENVSSVCDLGLITNLDNRIAMRQSLRGDTEEIKKVCSNSKVEEYLVDHQPIIWRL